MQTPTRKLRMGMVGGGQGAFIGGVHRMAAALDQQIDFVAGCFSRDYDNTLATGKSLFLSPDRCYRTYDQMAQAEGKLPADQRIDFVSIVTPNNTHFPIAKAFLDHGFHVVCDKPMTHSLDDAEKLVDLVDKSSLIFCLTHNYTGHPLVRHARHLVRTDQLGQIRKVIVEYLQDFLCHPHEKEGQKQALWRVDPAQAGVGGTLGDCGTHGLNLLEYVTGQTVAQVCADKTTFLPDRTLEEDANMLLRLDNGGKGLMTVSQIATGEENGLTLRVYGSKGAIRWAQENPNELDLYRYGQPRQKLTRGHGEFLSDAATASSRIPPGHPEGYLEAFATIYARFATAVRAHLAGTPLTPDQYDFPTAHDGLRGMKFIAAAVTSAENHSAWIDV